MTGQKTPPWLEAAVRRIGQTPPEVPCSSSFVSMVMSECGIAGTGSASARSWLDWGTRLDSPREGCVVVFSQPCGPATGHVNLFLGFTRNAKVRGVGVLRSGPVSVLAFPKWRVLGYRWPPNFPL